VSLEGRTAIVTGAAGGIGQEFVRALVRAGARVMATDIDDLGLRRLEETMSAEGFCSALISRHLDISDQSACAESVAAAQEQFGSLNILVNNGALGMAAIREDHITNLVGIDGRAAQEMMVRGRIAT
jgi:NAD(P)-dependent dehydrogenase (short-subunit alcohol dehydrogenase family)